MVAILNIIGPIYLAIALGFISVRCGVFQKNSIRVTRPVVYHAVETQFERSIALRLFGGFRTEFSIDGWHGCLVGAPNITPNH